jgi:flavorubredoxin
MAPNAIVVATAKGEEGLRRHFKLNMDFKVVGAGDTLNIGRRTLHFTPTPMVHWPDNMVTYVSPDKVLLSNDAFGQHIATSERFDDQLDWGLLRNEAGKYYANIVLPYGSQVRKALDSLSGVDIDAICPSHGIIWRSMIPDILGEYTKWCSGGFEKKAVIVYDSMWQSTAKMAQALREGLEEAGVPVTMRNLAANHISDIMTDVLSHRAVLLGSPTLNNSILPTMGAFLTYLRGLRPTNRIGFAFGSYGWGGQSVGELEKAMEMLGWEMPMDGIKLKFVPDADELAGVKEAGAKLAASILKD